MRYERKFASTSHDLGEVLAQVRNHPSFFRPIYHERQVNNVYFDTIDLRFLEANLQGTANRKKYRLRWYDDPASETVSGQLELKKRVGQLVEKHIWSQGKTSVSNWLDGSAIPTGIPDSVNNELKCLQATLLSGYTRQYFLSVDGKFRLTVDCNQWWQNLIEGSEWEDHRQVIIELKYDTECDGLAHQITSGFPFRVSKWSKYAAGFRQAS